MADILDKLGLGGPQPTSGQSGRPKDILDTIGVEGPYDQFLGKNPAIDTLAGMGETAYGMTMGLPVAAASGLYGIGKGVATGSLENVFRGAQEASDVLTWQPRTATAKYNYQMLAELLKPYTDIKEGAGKFLGSVTDNPFLGGTLEAAPNIAETFLPLKAAQLKLGSVKTKLDSAGRVLTPEEIEQIAFEEGLPVEAMYDKKPQSFTEVVIAGYDESGEPMRVSPAKAGEPRKYVPDPEGKSLFEDYNIPKSSVSFLKLSTLDDLELMRNMFDTYRSQRMAKRPGENNRYIDVIGETLANRIEYLGNIRRARGSQLDKLLQSPRMGQTVIDIGPEMGQWIAEAKQALNLKGISRGDGSLVFDYRGSVLENSPAAQKAINNILGSLRDGQFTAKDLHFLKKIIDEEISPSVSPQAGQGGVGGNVERLFTNLRSRVNDRLAAEIPAYGEINGQISEIIGVLEPLVNTVGKRIDLTTPEGVKQLALAMRRISSNAKSGVTLREAIPGLVEYVNKLAPNAFKDNPLFLQEFANILEKRFGSDVANSIGGIMEKTQARSAANVADVALEGMVTQGTSPGLVSGALKGIKNIAVGTEKSDAQAMAALRQYMVQLERELKKGKYPERSRKRGQQR